MTFQKKLSHEEELALFEEWKKEGWTVKELTIIYKVSERTVYRILNHYGAIPKGKSKKKRPRKPKPRVLMPCGTNAAYTRHLRNKEVPDELCVIAHRVDVKRFKDRKRKKNAR